MRAESFQFNDLIKSIRTLSFKTLKKLIKVGPLVEIAERIILTQGTYIKEIWCWRSYDADHVQNLICMQLNYASVKRELKFFDIMT